MDHGLVGKHGKSDRIKALALKNTDQHKASLSTSPHSPTEFGSRGSFSSVREQDDALAQTFTSTKVSSYSHVPDENVFVETPSPSPSPSPEKETVQPFFQPPLTQPNSKLHGFFYPSDSFRGWREIPLKGKQASRSCENLRGLGLTWKSPAITTREESPKPLPRGLSLLEQLPAEILSAVIDLLYLDIPPNGITTRNADLMALLLTSRSVHAATLNTLYRHVTIPHSRIFRKFFLTIQKFPALASIVRRMDFSHFNPSTIFSTASERAQTKNLTAESLEQCLQLTPYVQEFLAQEYIDDDISVAILKMLFLEMPQMRAVDFCGCSSTSFKDAFRSLVEENHWPDTIPIKRISFHKCASLPGSVYEMILPRARSLTHLDVAGTRITDKALESIPEAAELTHLNLARCKDLTSEAVVRFITTHPACRTLRVLSLATDSSSLLIEKADVGTLIQGLPRTLRSLSLKGSRMEACHIPLLLPLTQCLEELALGRGLSLNDMYRLFRDEKDNWAQHTIRYLDVADTDNVIGPSSALISSSSAPLHVIEVDSSAYTRMSKSKSPLEKSGWTLKEFGSRCWIVRMNADGTTRDNGGRSWKMGAENWGMRKIPVAVAEVGGMYGSFMFGRRV